MTRATIFAFLFLSCISFGSDSSEEDSSNGNPSNLLIQRDYKIKEACFPMVMQLAGAGITAGLARFFYTKQGDEGDWQYFGLTSKAMGAGTGMFLYQIWGQLSQCVLIWAYYPDI